MTGSHACPVCARPVLDLDRGHPERCPGPRLRQPTHAPWDWAGAAADQDADDLRGNGRHTYGSDDREEMSA